ncbi:MAG: LD-carboxypeptidase [Pseudobutyrivibrio sp.]|nr:LD-carboxypeptidase [Pseudobutyrivibrio sp.]
MRYPDFLQPGGTIGFVAPSFGCATEPYTSGFDAAIELFHERGYKTVEGPNCRVQDGYVLSNTPEKCGKELTECYCSSDSDVLISCGGGELMCDTMDFVDFDKIKAAEPKWYMGFSDNTNFTVTLNTLADTASIYGPCAASFGMKPLDVSLEDSLAALTGKKTSFAGYDLWEKDSIKDEEHPFVGYNLTEKKALRTFKGEKETTGEPVEVKGRLIGGCMDILFMHVGTEFDKISEFCEKYKDDGIIWFMEACEMNQMDIKRCLWAMEHAGWFKHVKGFVFGRPMMCMGGELFGSTHHEAIMKALAKYDVPVIMDADFGHLSPMVPIISGACCDVTVREGNIFFDYRFE